MVTALIDDGSSLSEDTAFGGDSTGASDTFDAPYGGTGKRIYDITGGGIAYMIVPRLVGESDAPASTDQKTGRRLFFVAGTKLLKVNVDPNDTTDGGVGTNHKHGMRIGSGTPPVWNGDRNFDYRAGINYSLSL